MRVLVAGVGNVFLGDDGLGVAAAGRLAGRWSPAEVEVVDFGIRGYDLAYALLEHWDAAILVDAVGRGGPPGTVFVLEPDAAAVSDQPSPDGHAMSPDRVLGLVQALGGRPPRLFVVGCEPASLGGEEGRLGLSPPVEAALDEVVKAVEDLVERVRREVGAHA
jgi:hydrogenase maturation protease